MQAEVYAPVLLLQKSNGFTTLPLIILSFLQGFDQWKNIHLFCMEPVKKLISYKFNTNYLGINDNTKISQVVRDSWHQLKVEKQPVRH